MSKIFLSAFLCIFCLSAQGATLFNTPPFHCKMSFADEATSPTELVFSVRSRLDKEVKLLTWYTPLEGMMSDLFIVTNAAGEALPYRGMMVKRGQPQEEDYASIPAGQAVEVLLQLEDAYPFGSGEYQIKLKPRMWQYRLGDNVLGREEFKAECGMEPLIINL